MENLENKNVKEVLEKIDKKSRNARNMGIALTVGAIIIASVVLASLLYLINSSYKEIVQLERKKAKLNEQIEKKRGTLENLGEKYADNLKIIEEVKKAPTIKKVEDILEKAEEEEKNSPPPNPTPTPSRFPLDATSRTSNVNVRTKPDLDADVIKKLGKGDKIKIVSYSENKSTWGGTTANWAEIEIGNGQTGFVFSPLISVPDEIEPAINEQRQIIGKQ